MEAQRAQRWRGRGPASGRGRGPSEFGQMEGARKRSRKDFLGYYRVLGIEEGACAHMYQSYCWGLCAHARVRLCVASCNLRVFLCACVHVRPGSLPCAPALLSTFFGMLTVQI